VKSGNDLVDVAGGVRLQRRWFLPAEPLAAVILTHGLGEHAGRYARLARWLADRHVAVHAYDLRGHGHSGGPRGHASSLAELVDDLERVVDAVRAQCAGLPLVLVGHSLGGLITAALLCERDPVVAGAVTSGAALVVPGLAGRRLTKLRLYHAITPRRALSNGLSTSALSRDPEVVRAYKADPLVHRVLTPSLAVEIARVSARVIASADAVRAPMLLLHGEADRICSPDGSRRFYGGLTAPGSRLRIYPGLYHEVFNEPEHLHVFGDVLRFIQVRIAPSHCPR
jgi:alpha-beta hydrolase superfamily lysophospholipase